MMSEWRIFQIGLAVWMVLAVLLAGWLSTVTRANLTKRERMPRWRLPGALLGFGALALTIPQAQALLWDWMLPYYLPGIILFAVLCYWKLDYLMARALAGIFMLAAYYFLYYSFALQSWMAPVGAVFSWIVGIAGILVAGKPCWMRDYLRLAARRGWVRMLSVFFLLITGIYALAVLMMGHES